MAGLVALIGSGEFQAPMADFDRLLLKASGAAHPRVAILPTASWPDGPAVFDRWAEMGVEHFRSLGAEVEAVPVSDHASACDPAHAQAVGEADVIYMSGGKPDYLLETLDGSAVWAAARAAHDRGAVLAGCSAGAMVLADRQPRFRRITLPFPLRWRESLGVVVAAAVLPHYDSMPETLWSIFALQAPKGVSILGIDDETAFLGRDGTWQVHGRGRVTVWRGRRRSRHRAGETVTL
ncbi:MAG TPA: Type 1 glutamine amidotransferase-like domain-containing protein [Candidatus Limnocylindrales bacterium]|nr:Type 1 glutamine amidotransferase-like domain-containing protein [Candidatus Limnocylindrales bacterium]